MTSDTQTPATSPEPSAEHTGIRGRADDLAHQFAMTDRIELGAAVLLALATVLAAWAAYQSTRWSGVQADSYSRAATTRAEATQATNVYSAQVNIDVEVFLAWLELQAAGDTAGADSVRERFRDEFTPAFETWMARAEPGAIPPDTPFSEDAYEPAAEAQAKELNAQADALPDQARVANQTSDNFVLMAVIMASVLFFAGVGTKFKGRRVRQSMLGMAIVLFVGGALFTISLPQNVGV
jgi:hypothetical protein